MNGNNSLAHTTWNCKYHIVFAPKYRRKILLQEYRVEMGKILRELPNFISSIKNEISEEQLKLKRVSNLIAAYEKIVEGNYIDNLIKVQREQELAKNGEKRSK